MHTTLASVSRYEIVKLSSKGNYAHIFLCVFWDDGVLQDSWKNIWGGRTSSSKILSPLGEVELAACDILSTLCLAPGEGAHHTCRSLYDSPGWNRIEKIKDLIKKKKKPHFVLSFFWSQERERGNEDGKEGGTNIFNTNFIMNHSILELKRVEFILFSLFSNWEFLFQLFW